MTLQSRRLAVGQLNIRHQNQHQCQQQSRLLGSLPTIAQSSFWKKLIPKPLRRGDDGTLPVAKAAANVRTAKEWNPATFYIFFFLFVGSMAIQMITLKKDFNTFMRQSEVKIGLLKEVVERIQKGETVDVERLLGTGDPRQEAEWEAGMFEPNTSTAIEEDALTHTVLRELQRDETSRASKRQEKAAGATTAPAADKTAPTSPAAIPDSSDSASTSKVASITSFY